MTSQAIRDIELQHTQHQLVEGWTPEKDDALDEGELEATASSYCDRAMLDIVPLADEPDRRGNLVKAGAFIVAAIERLDRAAAKAGDGSDET